MRGFRPSLLFLPSVCPTQLLFLSGSTSMPVRSAVKKQSKISVQPADAPDASAELKFISDLGRSLLFTVHPKKVASRVSSAIQHEADAEVCALLHDRAGDAPA